ncbi:MAG: hypothetical protein NZM12_02265, partial [Steroidobacteraceae bacterium]|nr:hypothetical protein [Steroidobacteraceae bacterium]
MRAQDPEQRRAEAQLAELQREIARVQAQVARDAAERDRLASRLRAAEKAAAVARRELRALTEERDKLAARRHEIAARRRGLEQALQRERAALGSQLRVAYMIGREEPLKLLLNQREPARAARMFVYYGYFGRARGAQITRIEAQVRELEALREQLEQADAQL